MSDKLLNPGDYIVTKDTEIADIDLGSEEFILRDGRRLTDELADELAEQGVAEARRRNLIPGGKSLSGDGSHSPVVRFRVPATVSDALHARADAEGRSESAIAREALERYLSV